MALGYIEYLIKQYYYKEKARADIELLDSRYEQIFDFYSAFEKEFDLDYARGKQLDIIGKIVGISRIVPKSLPKTYFGFDINPNAANFGSLSNEAYNFNSAQFFRVGQDVYTDTQLNDNDYRFFIKAKVALNYCSAVMAGDEETISINDVLFKAFDGLAYATDNKNMTMTLYVSPKISDDKLRLIKLLNLIPKSQCVNYNIIINAEPNLTFGFSNNPNAKGFGSGIFARIKKL